MTPTARAIGDSWEEAAAQFLADQGLQIIARHYACRLGEIDLIAADGETVVFVEVRYRACGGWGGAAASVTRTKQLRIVRAARHFIMRNTEFSQCPMRMDVVAIQGDADAEHRTPRMQWIRNAFEAA
ncbi:MAG TPA: YraN family protein [Gammaproteobacteria bacterium]|nr:YraN family protein [Gammaproteobacteria bacterium]